MAVLLAVCLLLSRVVGTRQSGVKIAIRASFLAISLVETQREHKVRASSVKDLKRGPVIGDLLQTTQVESS
jgi:hypothetical protein